MQAVCSANFMMQQHLTAVLGYADSSEEEALG